MTYTLRPYQEEAVKQGVHHLKNYANPFSIQAATGAGKSLMIAEICHRLNEPVLILQPSVELLEQNYAKLQSYGIHDIAIYSASAGQKNIAKYTYATIGSIYKKPWLFAQFKYVIVDECHVVNPKGFGMYKTFFEKLGIKHVCGLTATPYRIVNGYVTYYGETYSTSYLRMINRIHPFFFKKIVFKIETQELIDMGYLAPIKYHADQVLLDSLVVNKQGSDYTPDSLEDWGQHQWQRIVAVTRFSAEHAKRTLVFCTSIKQSKIVYNALSAGLSNVWRVDGETPKSERAEAVAGFRRAERGIMINVGVFTTGFDVPELNSIILGRPTMSLGLYYQMVGRGVRLDPEDATKVLRVFDLAGISERMGRVETIKLGKEPHPKIPHFSMDTLESEIGRVDEVPLFAFKIKKGSRR